MPPIDIATIKLKKILLVEEDPQDAELTLAALEESHLASQVAVVRDSEEALDYLYCRGKHSGRPPGDPILLLLDSKMPKASSLRVLKTIKVDEQLKSIPVVALTSAREAPAVAELYKHGVIAYVVKPADFTEFMKAIKQLGLFWADARKPTAASSAVAPLAQLGAAVQ